MRKNQHLRKLLLLCFMVFSFVFTFSQVKEQWVTKGGNELVVDNNGNVYIIGDYYTRKYDANGNKIWEKTGLRRALTVDRFGNLYVTGAIRPKENDYDYETIKYDPNGNELWVRHYNRPSFSYSYDQASDIALDSTGNVYVTGYSFDGLSGSLATIKYDSSGNELWISLYARGYPNAMAVDGYGNVYITASVSGNSSGYTIIKYSADGKELWAKSNNNGSSSLSIGLDRSGNAYITGRANGAKGDVDYLTDKHDTDGNLQWERRYDGGGYDYVSSLALDARGNIYITGASGDSKYNYDYATIKYDTNGKELWIKKFDAGGYDSADDIAVDSEGNVYVTGASYDIVGDGDYLTIKYDTDGRQLWSIRYDSPHHDYNIPASLALDRVGNIYVTGHGLRVDSTYATIKYTQIPTITVDAGKDITSYLLPIGPSCAKLTAKVTGGTPPYQYKWSPSGYPSENVFICPSVTTSYTVTITDATGSKATDEVTVQVVDVRCGDNKENVLLCHDQTTLCLNSFNAFWHLLHGDRWGRCPVNTPITGAPGLKEISKAKDEVKAFIAPNPFTSTTEIYYHLPYDGKVSVSVYNSMGAEINLLENGQQPAGAHRLQFNASNLAKGTYYYRIVLTTGNRMYAKTGKMIVGK